MSLPSWCNHSPLAHDRCQGKLLLLKVKSGTKLQAVKPSAFPLMVEKNRHGNPQPPEVCKGGQADTLVSDRRKTSRVDTQQDRRSLCAPSSRQTVTSALRQGGPQKGFRATGALTAAQPGCQPPPGPVCSHHISGASSAPVSPPILSEGQAH